ncbi:MAG: hypothetical protein H7Y60_01945 [Rhodospirillaceae bacterium]|nr:hypothetical protein [Rhodospirillales bacterium]
MSTRLFHLSARFCPEGRLEDQGGAGLIFDRHLAVEAANLHPPARHYQAGGCDLVVWGNPIVDGQIDDRAVLRLFEGAADTAAFARALDGSFLILLRDPARRTFSVISDRFGSLAVYWRMDQGVLSLSTSFKSILDGLMREQRARLKPEAIFEFLHFRRLFGTHTFEADTVYLDSASVLSYGPGQSEPSVTKYWQPSFAPTPLKGKALAAELADGLHAAMDSHMSDDRRFGLMLSGGLDARALLAAAPRPPVCFTTCLTRNNEFEVAAELARGAGAEHIFVERPKDMLNDVVDDCVWLAGMQIYPEFQFAPYGPAVLPKADSIFLGLALDVFFAGLYLPKRPRRVLGRETLMYALKPLGDDLPGAFMNGVSYRLKTSSPWSIVKDGARAGLEESLRASVGGVMAHGKDLGADSYGQWEYMHLHNFSRHYSFPMAASIRGYADCRIPALTNRLFDLAFAMQPEDKANWAVYQQAIDLCDPAMMSVRNANTNIRASRSLAAQTAIHFARAAAKRVIGNRFRSLPPWWERSWPPASHSIEHNPRIREMVSALTDSPRLDSLGFLDPAKIRSAVAEHQAGTRDHSVMLNMLVTVDRCLTPRAVP